MAQPGFSVVPLSVGAEIVGLAPGQEEVTTTRRALYEAWLEYGVLLFRGVDSIERHLAISRCFGELEIHPVPEVRYSENPFLIEIGGPKRTAAYVFDEADVRVNRIAWHRDTAYTPDICKGAMLRMLEVPAHEGETMFADTALAWDDLPAELKARLEGLEYKGTLRTCHMNTLGRPGTFWRAVRPATNEEDPVAGQTQSLMADIDARYPSVIHPVVLTHPESGRKCLFFSPTYVDLILGMEQSESDALVRQLTDHMLQPNYVYTHKWSPNDAIIWDNRRFMHASVGNRPDEPRYGLRTTLAGPLRTGRYFDDDARAPESALAD